MLRAVQAQCLDGSSNTFSVDDFATEMAEVGGPNKWPLQCPRTSEDHMRWAVLAERVEMPVEETKWFALRNSMVSDAARSGTFDRPKGAVPKEDGIRKVWDAAIAEWVVPTSDGSHEKTRPEQPVDLHTTRASGALKRSRDITSSVSDSSGGSPARRTQRFNVVLTRTGIYVKYVIGACLSLEGARTRTHLNHKPYLSHMYVQGL